MKMEKRKVINMHCSYHLIVSSTFLEEFYMNYFEFAFRFLYNSSAILIVSKVWNSFHVMKMVARVKGVHQRQFLLKTITCHGIHFLQLSASSVDFPFYLMYSRHRFCSPVKEEYDSNYSSTSHELLHSTSSSAHVCDHYDSSGKVNTISVQRCLCKCGVKIEAKKILNSIKSIQMLSWNLPNFLTEIEICFHSPLNRILKHCFAIPFFFCSYEYNSIQIIPMNIVNLNY